jgi:Response regulator containing a CheY-like receiver domain and an HTH DNA-binding domain
MIDIEGINRTANDYSAESGELGQDQRQQIMNVTDDLKHTVDSVSTVWSRLGLSDREAEVAAYRELGFTNKSIAYMLDISTNTVNEYTRRAKQKYNTARALLAREEDSQALSKNWVCPKPSCGHETKRAYTNSKYNPDTNVSTWRCQECHTEYQRKIQSPDV